MPAHQASETFDRWPVALVRLNPDGRCQAANPAAARLFGHLVVGLPLADLVDSDELQPLQTELAELTAGAREALTRATRLRRADAVVVHAQLHATAVDAHLLVQLQDIGPQHTLAVALRDSEDKAQVFGLLSSEILAISERGILIECNDAMPRFFGRSREALLGRPILELVDPAWRDLTRRNILGGREEPYETHVLRGDGTVAPVTIQARAISYQGRMVRAAVLHDLTAQRQAAAAHARAVEQEITLRTQSELLAELSTPLIPISERAVVMPLIGMMDPARAERVLGTLLSGVAGTATQVVILDITGVKHVDAAVADTLIRAARAVRLLGAEVILTGIHPHVAQVLVDLHADLSGIVTLATVQDGISHAARLTRSSAPKR